MDRINVYRVRTDETDFDYEPGEGRHLVGHFDMEKAERFEGNREWDGNNMACVHLKDGNRGQNLIRTAGGRWVLQQWSNYVGEGAEHAFISDESAREWLLINDNEDVVEQYFGEQPEESGPNLGGRPQVGPKVEVRLDEDTLAQVTARAEKEGVARAEMIRRLVIAAL